MDIFLTSLHVMACLLLILVVLLQRGKGADMGAMLGGGSSQTVFGGRGAGNFLTKLTAGTAATFMITSLTLSYLSNSTTEDLIFGDEPVIEETSPANTLEEVEDAAADTPSANALEEIPIPAPAEATE